MDLALVIVARDKIKSAQSILGTVCGCCSWARSSHGSQWYGFPHAPLAVLDLKGNRFSFVIFPDLRDLQEVGWVTLEEVEEVAEKVNPDTVHDTVQVKYKRQTYSIHH